MQGQTPILRVEHLSVAYGHIRALIDISFEIPHDAVVCLIGANGAGKTTTLLTISGILRPSAGQIFFEGRNITRMAPHRVVELGIVHVPEGRAVLSQMSVQENLEMGGYRRRDRAQLLREVAQMTDRFPILGERRHLPAGSLSGGEQQVLAIARGLLARPKLLLLDEPSMGLAPQRVAEVFEILKGIHQDGVSILLVEQNARRALAMSDHAYVLETGHVSIEGTGSELLRDPAVTQAYLGQANPSREQPPNDPTEAMDSE
jgi:branched-chain amino acid transport system ATP-binding protein